MPISKIENASLATSAVGQSNMGTGVAGTGPAFSAYQSSAQSISANTNTKVSLQSEEFDTANCFDSTTNYRFTPNVAGYYQISGNVQVTTAITTVVVMIYKNGSIYKGGYYNSGAGGGGGISSLVYFNGSTDYVELYVLFGSTQNASAASSNTWFNGALVRAA